MGAHEDEELPVRMRDQAGGMMKPADRYKEEGEVSGILINEITTHLRCMYVRAALVLAFWIYHHRIMVIDNAFWGIASHGVYGSGWLS